MHIPITTDKYPGPRRQTCKIRRLFTALEHLAV